MIPIKDRRVRAILAAALVAIIGYSIYQGALYFWTRRLHDAALAALVRYDYDEAAQYLNRYLYWRPRDPDALMLASQTARRRHAFDEAVSLLRLAHKHGAPQISLKTEHELLQVQRGQLGGVDELMRFCQAEPTSVEAAIVLEALIEGGMLATNEMLTMDAVNLWLRHRASKLEQAQGLVWRGRANLTFGHKVPLPQDDFRQAVELAPAHFQARLYLAAGWINQQPELAAPHIEWLEANRPNDPDARFHIARFHRYIGRTEEAARQFDDLIERAPNQQLRALVERARVAMDLQRPQEAEPFLLKAMSLAPQSRDVNVAMAECLRQLNRLDEADRHVRFVKEIDEKLDRMQEEFKKRQEVAQKKKAP
jgi:tetratricopeptide (TPR) repeat protein